MAQKEDQMIAGLILFKFKDRVSAEFLASDDNYLNLSPNHLLFWEAIKEAHAEGFKIFDFGRTSPLNSSLMEFKNRWGTTVVDLPHFIYPDRMYKVIANREKSTGFKLSKILCQYAPEPFYSLIGRFYYRHLG
jgi:lipid II:glycine glycyltransferase (peptidoglycan interpeptide bridge formation enzyme)